MTNTQVYFLLLGFLLVLPAFITCQGVNDYMLEEEEEDVLTPIQILKKGQSIMGLRMCLLHPRNCPAGFRKRDAPKLTDSTADIKQPRRKEMMNILRRWLRSYLDQKHDIVVDYMPRRILLGGSKQTSRR